MSIAISAWIGWSRTDPNPVSSVTLMKGFSVQRTSTLERAFALAEAGSCRSVTEIRTQLKREQFDSVDAHLSGSSIQKQLKARMAGAGA